MEKKILTIEDDTFLQGLEVAELKKNGFAVLIAQNGEQGLKVLETETVDCVLLDLMMPGTVDGFGVLEGMKKNPKLATVPVIVFTNFGDEEKITKALALGAREALVKSNFTLLELAEKIKTIVG